MWEVSAILDDVEQNSRTWYEWIDSKSNPSDGLSREGLSCPVARSICKTGLWEWPSLTKMSAEQLRMEMKNSGDISERNSGRCGKSVCLSVVQLIFCWSDNVFGAVTIPP